MPLPPPSPPRRPREAITEDALSVHPALIGLPLAQPWRRLLAIAFDGTLVLLLTQAPNVLFGIAAALVLFRASSRRAAAGGYVRQSLRLGFRVAGAVTLFVVAIATWDRARDRISSGFGSSEASVSASVEERTVQVGGEDPLFGNSNPGVEQPIDRDSLSVAYANAITANDSAAARTLLPRLTSAWAADTAAALAAQVERLREDEDDLRSQLDALRESEENRSIMQRVRSIADDLGLGLGWIGLYFTSTLALWQGKTPGKRLLGIRVIRLNGKPIGWWAAFERFGGYAAGFATGLLGFAQILWDRNRQAIHDKITETAVIRG